MNFETHKIDPNCSSLVFLTNAKRLLSEGNVREAEALLRNGQTSYPDNRQIAQLLRAISPGRVSKINKVFPNRDREMDWIQQNGQNYRGKWVAIHENELVASSDKLNKLIKIVQQKTNSEELPLIQRIVESNIDDADTR